MIFLDADIRLPIDFFESFLKEFEDKQLDIACPQYSPRDSTSAISGMFVYFNLLFRAVERVLPSGAGGCIAVRGELFRKCRGFDPTLKFEDIEMIRRLSKGRRFGIIPEKVYFSDRRFREQGVPRMILMYELLSLFFALGKFRWANRIDYEFGKHED